MMSVKWQLEVPPGKTDFHSHLEHGPDKIASLLLDPLGNASSSTTADGVVSDGDHSRRDWSSGSGAGEESDGDEEGEEEE